jgi:hypothetical protein
MQLVTLDFETYWSKTHSLSKMLPMAYVMHPETEIISCALKVGDGPTSVYFGEDEIVPALQQVEWSRSIAMAHNMSGFDAMILAWRFGVRPKMWACTLAMARPIHSLDVGNSLAKLVAHYRLGVKDNTVLMNTQGRNLKDFTAAEREQMRTYNKADTDQCYALFHRLKPHYDAKEMWQIDATIRMLVEPKFVVNQPMLETALSVERSRKHKALLEVAKGLRVPVYAVSDLEIDPYDDSNELDWHDEDAVAEFVRSELASAPKFSALLEKMGVEMPMKASPTNPDKLVPALAKSDQAFLDLQDHPDERVATAARARLAVKSTLLESRIESFLEVAGTAKGRLPVPLNYCGAVTTGRWSGWAFNPQNLPRIDPRNPKLSDALRNCMKAPDGHAVVVADLSGIELRVNMFLWKVSYAMELFRADPEKADLYRYFAAHELYNIVESEVTKNQRQVGKVSHLGLGFGAGAATFQKVAKMMGGVELSLEECQNIVTLYRTAHRGIAQGWRECHNALRDIYEGVERPIDPWELCWTEKDAIRLPSGRRIRYPGLHIEAKDGKDEWWYGEGRYRARIYGPKVVENIVQALARDAMADYSVVNFQKTGYRPALLVHDEWVGVVPQADAPRVLESLQQTMRTPLAWWPELVTWSEGDIANTYGAAK